MIWPTGPSFGLTTGTSKKCSIKEDTNVYDSDLPIVTTITMNHPIFANSTSNILEMKRLEKEAEEKYKEVYWRKPKKNKWKFWVESGAVFIIGLIIVNIVWFLIGISAKKCQGIIRNKQFIDYKYYIYLEGVGNPFKATEKQYYMYGIGDKIDLCK